MSIKAVAFDYGNVISLEQDPMTMGLLAAIADISEEEAFDIAFTGRDDWDRGDLSGPDHYKRGFERLGKTADEGTLYAFMRGDLESWANINGETVKLIEEIIAGGFKTAILSNMPQEFIGTVRKRFPIVSKVDVAVFSCEHSVVKPAEKIYQILLDKLALSAPEVLFFDDLSPNIEAARNLGIVAHVWKNAAEARKILADTGVLKS